MGGHWSPEGVYTMHLHKSDTHFHRTREAVETVLAVLLGLIWGGYAVLMLL